MNAGWYEIADVTIAVQPRKANGDAWDAAGGLPDPKIEILVDGKHAGRCRTVENTLQATCHPDLVVKLDPGSRIELRVVDADVARDDTIGNAVSTSLEPPTFSTDGQLVSATVQLAPAKAPVDASTSSGGLFAVLAGTLCVVGLAFYFIRPKRRKLAQSQPAAPVRCAYCSATVDPTAAACPNCGAKR